eukprot:gnl/TRDRNA2_/TRDRNA2_193485_c0_seq1.p1 gnl/TRDRNA2_/TRDRNA2_193485_c0~~gnl/TRDRNA2_/TRDRNA2_193485_c0_seq1.p1  ORF type:complete len:313 (-),score=44.90 gnl/TRDRNA2_/TRDRNA2_193485_c0_seq1:77-1015(-)
MILCFALLAVSVYATRPTPSDPYNSGPLTLSSVSVAFGIMTSSKPEYVKKLQSPLRTWARDLTQNELLIVGSAAPDGMEGIAHWDSATNCPDNHETGLACKEALLISNARDANVDWVVVLNEDNYVFPEHIKKELQKLDFNKPQILGIVGCATKNCSGICGGGAEMISRGAMKQMLERGRNDFLNEHANVAKIECEGWSDQTTSMVAKRHGVELRTNEGTYGWALNRSQLSERVQSSRPEPLVFHYVTEDDFSFIQSMVEAKRPSSIVEIRLSSVREITATRSADNARRTAFIREANMNIYSKTTADYYGVL